MKRARGVAALASVATSAALFVLAFPPAHLRGLAWVALVPLLLALRLCGGARSAAALAALWGMLAAYGTTDWLPPTLEVYYAQPAWVGLALFVTAAFLMGATEYAAFAYVYRRLAERGAGLLPLLAGAAWAVAELGRDNLLTGNPWGLLGYSQMPVDDVASSPARWLAARAVQVADLGGVYAVGFVLVCVNALVAEAALAIAGSRLATKRLLRDASAVAAVVVAALAYGELRLREPLVPDRSVAVVQANLDLGARWDPSLYGKNLGAYLELTRETLAREPAALVVWPENAMTFFVDREPLYRDAISAVLAPSGASLLAGAPRRDGDLRPRYFNSAFLIGPAGDVVSRYDKQHLLPFAEYFPFSSVGLLRRSFARVREFSAGTNDAAAPLATPIGRSGVLVCNEAMFPALARRRVTGGAELLVNLSNDSWVASTEFAEHQFALATMRAVEQRRYLVRASTSGPSAVVDPCGRVVRRTQPFTADAFVARVAARRQRSPYARSGEFFGAACALALAGAWYVSRRRSFAR